MKYKHCKRVDDNKEKINNNLVDESLSNQNIEEGKNQFKKNWKFNLKKNLFGNTKFNYRSEIYKVVLSALILAISVGFSLVELGGALKIPLYTPWGTEFDYRFFDTLFLFIGIRMVGLLYCIIVAAILPWLHLLIDGAHSVISILGFMLTDILCVFLFWLIYYKIFKAGLEKHIELCDANITQIKEESKINSLMFNKTSIKKRIFAMSFICLISAFVESLLQVAVIAFMFFGVFTPGDDETGQINGIGVVFSGINILWLILFFAAVFLIKYIVEGIIFLLLEKRTSLIADHFGVF